MVQYYDLGLRTTYYQYPKRKESTTQEIFTAMQLIIFGLFCYCNDVLAFSTPPLSNTRRITTRLYEQPANIRKLLGSISPSTLEVNIFVVLPLLLLYDILRYSAHIDTFCYLISYSPQQYNIPPSELTNAWNAQIVTKQASKLMSKSSEIGNQEILGKQSIDVELVPKNTKEHYVDTFKVKVSIPSLNKPGLGIELFEVEGGRNDGLGITIITGLVPNGNAEQAMEQSIERREDVERIMYGDSISKAELTIQRQSTGNVRSVQTECLGYDSTVEELVDMLSTLNTNRDTIQEASVILTIKRIRRRPIIKVNVQYPPSENLPSETINLQPGDNLRLSMLQRNIALNDPLAQRYDGKITSSGNCGGSAMCRTCAVSVIRGSELLSEPKVNEKKIIQETKNVSRMRLSCKTFVGKGMKEGELVIQVNPRQW